MNYITTLGFCFSMYHHCSGRLAFSLSTTGALAAPLVRVAAYPDSKWIILNMNNISASLPAHRETYGLIGCGGRLVLFRKLPQILLSDGDEYPDVRIRNDHFSPWNDGVLFDSVQVVLHRLAKVSNVN